MEGLALGNQVETKVNDRVKIIAMLYDGAINFINIAKDKLVIGDSIGKTHYINKTTAIVKELSKSINIEGGEIALNLRNLYDFVLESLIKAEVHNNLDALNDAEKVIEILRSAWKEMQVSNQM
ncbi:MAG: flagellar export chaperone FliS [Nitrospirae bacterium]|nr:flagellar export chaperone FliS [Nitrospirota bacterium]